MGCPDSCRLPRQRHYLGDFQRKVPTFRLRGFHPLWRPIPRASARWRLCNSSAWPQPCTEDPATPDRKRLRAITPAGFGLVPFRSPLLRKSLRFPFLQVLRCFSSLGVASDAYGFSAGFRGMTPGGLSHSETHGSGPANGSPWISLCGGVLHRLSAPKHPPSTLRSLTVLFHSGSDGRKRVVLP